MRNLIHYPLCFILAAAVVSATGCDKASSPTSRLEGSVTLDGEPLEQGTISFAAIDGGASAAAEIVAGQYQAEGVPRGKVRVTFQATKETGKTIDMMGKSTPERINVIPDEYRTGVEIEVTQPSMRQDFDMLSK